MPWGGDLAGSDAGAAGAVDCARFRRAFYSNPSRLNWGVRSLAHLPAVCAVRRRKTSMDDPSSVAAPGPAGTRASCPSCGAGLTGRYCAECGERSTGRADLSLLAFLKDALYELANADSRVWRSLRSLLLQPGRLSEEYLAGRRRPWLGPVQLFLI